MGQHLSLGWEGLVHATVTILKTNLKLSSIFSSFEWLIGSVAEWLACWTQAQYGLGSDRSHDAVG